MTEEKRIRLYANHMGLTVRRRGEKLELWERSDLGFSGHRDRFGLKAKIGSCRSWPAVERGIERYGDKWLRENVPFR